MEERRGVAGRGERRAVWKRGDAAWRCSVETVWNQEMKRRGSRGRRNGREAARRGRGKSGQRGGTWKTGGAAWKRIGAAWKRTGAAWKRTGAAWKRTGAAWKRTGASKKDGEEDQRRERSGIIRSGGGVRAEEAA